jgi:endogenous inhibitor of DNA gyrase (YacG/DUF329 family)
MASMLLDSTIGTKLRVNACAACSLLWFDGASDTRLAPASVVAVFKTIAAGGERPQIRPELRCPDCGGALAFIHDLLRQTRFTYWRCAADHGHLIGYSQFLLEKNFIRPPSSEELARLRATVREITCSQCGAPIDLATDSSCPFCHAPVTLIDPDGLAKAVHELSLRPSDPPAQSSSATTAGAAMHEAQMKAIFDPDRIARSDGRNDLVSIGAGAIGGLLAGLI